MKKITRRSFLAYIALLAGSARAGKHPPHLPDTSVMPVSKHDWPELLAGVIGPYESILVVGHARSLCSPQEECSAWSRQFIIELGTIDKKRKTDLARLRQRYLHQIKTDFNKGNTVNINGYILSITEVDVCRWLSALRSGN